MSVCKTNGHTINDITGECMACGETLKSLPETPDSERAKRRSSSSCSSIPVVIDPDYSAFIVQARLIAKQEGYALAIHGSTTRDLDLIAIPWVDKVCSPASLACRISHATGWPRQKEDGRKADIGEVVEPCEREHGRLQWSMLSPNEGILTDGAPDPRYIDFSVIPPNAKLTHSK